MPEFLTTLWNGFTGLFSGIPEGLIAVVVYVGGTLLALWAGYNVVRRMPKLLAIILWTLLFALLVTPTVSEGQNAGIAPALIGMVFGMLIKDKNLILYNGLSMLLVWGISLLVAYCLDSYFKYRRLN